LSGAVVSATIALIKAKIGV
jgi:hypothetical protein